MDIKVQRGFSKKRIWKHLLCACLHMCCSFTLLFRSSDNSHSKIQNPDLTFELWRKQGSRFQHPPQGCRFWGGCKTSPQRKKNSAKGSKVKQQKIDIERWNNLFPEICLSFFIQIYYTCSWKEGVGGPRSQEGAAVGNSQSAENGCCLRRVPRRAADFWLSAKNQLAESPTECVLFGSEKTAQCAWRICPPQDTWLRPYMLSLTRPAP